MKKIFDHFRLILMLTRIIGITEGPYGGITHVLGGLKRLKINARHLGPGGLLA